MKTFGNILILLGLIILLFIFGPVLKGELGYHFSQLSRVQYSLDAHPDFPQTFLRAIEPIDRDFGIVIPEIRVNAPIYPEVNPGNPDEFLPILRKGVAHAKGSAYPGKEGNVYLFAHSTDAFYNITQYNAVFFLIGKLDVGDEISIFYKNKRYRYVVRDKKVLGPEKVWSYLKSIKGKKTLTLQTCYPPGTTLNRLLVVAKLVD